MHVPHALRLPRGYHVWTTLTLMEVACGELLLGTQRTWTRFFRCLSLLCMMCPSRKVQYVSFVFAFVFAFVFIFTFAFAFLLFLLSFLVLVVLLLLLIWIGTNLCYLGFAVPLRWVPVLPWVTVRYMRQWPVSRAWHLVLRPPRAHGANPFAFVCYTLHFERFTTQRGRAGENMRLDGVS